MTMQSHDIDYQIIGNDIQLAEIELDPNETVVAEAGAMLYMEENINFEAKMGDGSEPDKGMLGKMFDAGSRAISGESIFLTHFTNQGAGKKKVAFAAGFPGTIVGVDLSKVGGHLTCQRDSFLCAALGTKVSTAFNRKLGAGLFGGEGFILQSLEGDGKVCIHAGGKIIKKKLNGETLRVDTGCLVAFTDGIDYNIERAGGLKTMLLGGEGLFMATLSGHGTVLLQSLPFSRMADKIMATSSVKSSSSGGASGAIGNIADVANMFGK
ncbi:MAG: TIGR00266 family protein [Proteobacteria bacterium]|nr:TIGR00266 family protein [Pseudomonadota bacterium]